MKTNYTDWKLLVILTLLLSGTFHLSAQSSTNNATLPFDSITTIFQDIKEKEKLVLETNLDSLFLNKKKDQYQPAKLKYISKNQEVVQLSIKIKPRGKSRRGICEMPPLKLNFNKADLSNRQLYKAYDKLKLVTHCQLDGDMDPLILKEYWTYKLYNEVSPHSYQVKLLEITYIDSVDPTRTFDSYAILIENTKEMAHRIGGISITQFGTAPDQLTAASNANLHLFNYMIGNTDWALHVQRNVKLLRIKSEEKLTAIPYDFDQAKLVDAPYIKVNKNLLKPNSTNRHVMGKINNQGVLEGTIAKFKALKKTGFKVYKNCPYLKRKDKTKMSVYLESFYQELKNNKEIQAIFQDKEVVEKVVVR